MYYFNKTKIECEYNPNRKLMRMVENIRHVWSVNDHKSQSSDNINNFCLKIPLTKTLANVENPPVMSFFLGCFWSVKSNESVFVLKQLVSCAKIKIKKQTTKHIACAYLVFYL